VLSRHGFAGLLRGQGHWPKPTDVRAAFEELGVVFLKLGQVLSTRRDLLPPEYITELEKLQDDIPAESEQTVREVLEEELGQAQAELAGFDPQPLAAATIAQVHAAELRDGREVVVKVQRPGLEDRIAEDIVVLAYVAAALDGVVPAVRPFDPPAMVREFHAGLLRELDFRREARNVRRFRAALADEPGVWIPDVIPDLCTARVITFERSHGEHMRAFVGEHTDKAPALARQLAALFLRQVFAEGLFHADPHPGNFFVFPDGTLCLHDFGMIGELDPEMRDTLADLLEAVVRGNPAAASQAYFDFGLVGPDVDRRAVEDGIGELLREVRAAPLAEISVGDALTALLRLGSTYRIRNPGVLLLLTRAFVTLEAVMRSLDPNLNVLEAFQQALPDVTKRRFAPGRLAADAADAARSLDRLLREAPGELRHLLRRVSKGELGEVQVRDHPSATRERHRALLQLLRTLAAGFLTLAGAVLLRETGWRLGVGLALLAGGLGGMALTGLRRRFKQ